MMNTSTPDLTSADSLANYPPGDTLMKSQGPAWRDVQMSVFSLSSSEEAFDMPAVSEPFFVWIVAGEAQTEEHELGDQPLTTHIGPGSLFLTMAGAPYAFKWKRLSNEPLEVVLLLLGMPIFDAALQELYGERAQEAHFRNVSGAEDSELVALLSCLRGELAQPDASARFVRGMTDAIAVQLARRYVDIGASNQEGSSLPAYKLRLVTLWMAEHLAEPFSLAALADIAGISEFHFNRLICVLEDWMPSFPGYHIYYASRLQHSPALALVVGALRHLPPQKP
jgi:AraC family transcriptional regulator